MFPSIRSIYWTGPIADYPRPSRLPLTVDAGIRDEFQAPFM
jgi:hypothetical protein